MTAKLFQDRLVELPPADPQPAPLPKRRRGRPTLAEAAAWEALPKPVKHKRKPGRPRTSVRKLTHPHKRPKPKMLADAGRTLQVTLHAEAKRINDERRAKSRLSKIWPSHRGYFSPLQKPTELHLSASPSSSLPEAQAMFGLLAAMFHQGAGRERQEKIRHDLKCKLVEFLAVSPPGLLDAIRYLLDFVLFSDALHEQRNGYHDRYVALRQLGKVALDVDRTWLALRDASLVDGVITVEQAERRNAIVCSHIRREVVANDAIVDNPLDDGRRAATRQEATAKRKALRERKKAEALSASASTQSTTANKE